jgi:hypothetical protein
MRYTARLAEAGIAPSVGSRGDSYDNALAESIIGLFKTEVIQRKGPWRQLEGVEFATLAWVDWFNHRRLLEPIGYVPPRCLRSVERKLPPHEGGQPLHHIFGTGGAVPVDLTSHAAAARRTRVEANRSAACGTCPSIDAAA